MAKNKHDKQKRSWGGAIKRTKPSEPGIVIDKEIRAAALYARVYNIPENPRVLDYGCGHGFDADHFGWESWDPYYRHNNEIKGPYDFVVCINVLNVLSKNNRAKAIKKIRSLLTDDGIAYLAVPRNIPVTGKLGIHHSLQNYVVFSTGRWPSPFSHENPPDFDNKKHVKAVEAWDKKRGAEPWRKHMLVYYDEPDKFIIYQMSKTSKFKDKTKEFMTARDKRARK